MQTEFVETAGWPNFHAVKIRVNSVDISVVGTRIQNGRKLTKSEFKCRFSEFCAFINYLTTLLETKNVIALGPFNNARILGNEGETNVEEIDKAYQEHGVELVQSPYNLQKARAYLLRNTGGGSQGGRRCHLKRLRNNSIKMVIKVADPDHVILWVDLELPRQGAARPKGLNPQNQDCARTSS